MSSFLFILIIITIFIDSSKGENKTCSGDCQCDVDGVCRLECIGNTRCKGSSNRLQCRTGYPCIIICDANGGKEACMDTDIDASGATDVTLICTDELACGGSTNFDCGTGNCHVLCSGSLACSNLQFECRQSICSLDCASSSSCSDINIDDNTAQSWQCINSCSGNGIPDNSPTTSSTAQPTKQPSNNPLISPTTAQPTVSPTTREPTKSPSNNPTLSPSNNPTRSPITDFPTKLPTDNPSKDTFTSNPTISPTTPAPVSTVTDDNGNIIATEREAGVVETTRDEINDDNLDSIKDETGLQSWIYIVIGCGVLCCCILVLIVWIRHRQNRERGYFSNSSVSTNASIPSRNPQVDRVQSNSKVRVLSDAVHSDNSKYHKKNTFERHLVNGLAADDIVMDDIVNEMNGVEQSGHIEMNPLSEGGVGVGVGDEILLTKGGPINADKNDNDIDNINNNNNNVCNDEEVVDDIDDMMETAGKESKDTPFNADIDDIDDMMEQPEGDTSEEEDDDVVDDIDDIMVTVGNDQDDDEHIIDDLDGNTVQ